MGKKVQLKLDSLDLTMTKMSKLKNCYSYRSKMTDFEKNNQKNN